MIKFLWLCFIPLLPAQQQPIDITGASVVDGTGAGPHIQFAARMTTPDGHGAEAGWGDFFSIEVSTAREAAAQAKKLTAIVAEAHKAGIPVLTHTVRLQRTKSAAQSGVDVVANGIGNAPTDPAITALMKQKGTTYATTLAVYEPRPRNQMPPLFEAVLEPACAAL